MQIFVHVKDRGARLIVGKQRDLRDKAYNNRPWRGTCLGMLQQHRRDSWLFRLHNTAGHHVERRHFRDDTIHVDLRGRNGSSIWKASSRPRSLLSCPLRLSRFWAGGCIFRRWSSCIMICFRQHGGWRADGSSLCRLSGNGRIGLIAPSSLAATRSMPLAINASPQHAALSINA